MLNKVILMGRLTKDPEIRYTQSAEPLAIANYTLAVSRKFKRENEPDADFIPCSAFGKTAEFVEKYVKKGSMIAVTGRMQVRSWENQQGQKHWTTEVIVEDQVFAESKKAEEERNAQNGQETNYNQQAATPPQYQPQTSVPPQYPQQTTQQSQYQIPTNPPPQFQQQTTSPQYQQSPPSAMPPQFQQQAPANFNNQQSFNPYAQNADFTQKTA